MIKKIFILSLVLIFPSILKAQNNTCLTCHLGVDATPVLAFQKSIHKKAGVYCQDCHGGNPKINDETSMDEQFGFIGVPEKDDLIITCGKCHAKTGKFVFTESSPNCIECHSAHFTKRAGIFMVGGSIYFIAFTIISLAAFFTGFFIKYAKYKKGRKIEIKTLFKKGVFKAIKETLTNASIFSNDTYAGIFHLFIFWGFLLLFIGNLIIWFDKLLFQYFFSNAQFLYNWFYRVFSYFTDLAALIVIVGIILVIIRRAFIKPKRLNYKIIGNLSLTKLLVEDWLFVIFIFILGLGGIFLEGFRILLHSTSLKTHSFTGLGTAYFLKALGVSSSASEQIYKPFWWFHVISAFLFIGYIPFSKARHIILDFFSIALHDEQAGRVLPPALEGESAGYTTWKDLTQKELLQLDACTKCGRCYEVCPATMGGFPLSPRMFILNLREAVNQQKEDKLAGEIISKDTLWSCMTCFACMERCPIKIEHIPIMVNLRRYLVEQGEVDKSLQDALMSLVKRGNSLKQSDRMRAKWTKGLDFKIKDARKEEVEYLWFVGDFASYDPIISENTKRFARVLNKAGIDFGILYDGERNSGNDVRRVGEEGLFEMLVSKNIKVLEKAKFKKIVTTDPHTYHTLKNEYPEFGAKYEVYHYTEILEKLLKEGKLQIKNKLNYCVTYHDPCYLGRYNGIYEPPRNVLKMLGVRLIEMPKNRNLSPCCGAGGGRIWMEEMETEGERPAESRVKEAVAIGAEIFVIPGPKGFSMFSDAVKITGLENKLKVKDIIELVEEAIE